MHPSNRFLKSVCNVQNHLMQLLFLHPVVCLFVRMDGCFLLLAVCYLGVCLLAESVILPSQGTTTPTLQYCLERDEHESIQLVSLSYFPVWNIQMLFLWGFAAAWQHCLPGITEGSQHSRRLVSNLCLVFALRSRHYPGDNRSNRLIDEGVDGLSVPLALPLQSYLSAHAQTFFSLTSCWMKEILESVNTDHLSFVGCISKTDERKNIEDADIKH